MQWSWQDWFVPLTAAVGIGLGIIPVFHHLHFGLRERREEVLGYFQPHSILLYFKRFYAAEWSGMEKKSNDEITRIFKQMYDRRFGIRTFLFPFPLYFLALVVLVGIISFAILRGNPKWLGGELEVRGLYALAGAYLWVIIDLIARYRQRNLVPSALYWYTFRFLLSIPMAASLSTLFTEAVAPAIAFALGAFPTDTLMLILRRQAGQRLGLGNDVTTNKLELENLLGINTAIAEKFSEIGVTTMLQLAYEDPIQLTMRTNLSFNFIADVISQAQASVYGLNLDITSSYSVRNSFEAAEVFENYTQNENQEEKARAGEVIAALAAKLGKSEKIVLQILSNLREDPYTEFIRDIWVADDEAGEE